MNANNKTNNAKKISSKTQKEIRSARNTIKTSKKTGVPALVSNSKVPTLQIPSDMRIAGSIALPVTFPACRWASEFSQKHSAVANPFAITVSDFGAAPSADPMLSANESLSFLFRSPERNSIIYLQNTAGALFSYTGRLIGGGGSAPSSSATYLTLPNVSRQLSFTQFVASTPFQPHGPILFPGSVTGSNGRFVWCNINDSLDVTTTVSNTGVVEFGGDYYGPNGLVPGYTEIQTPILTTGVPSVINIKPSGFQAGYYSVSILTPIANAVTVTARVSGGGAVFAHLPLPGYASNYTAAEGCRILGASMMLTNTAPMLNLGGTVTAVQTDVGDDWQDFVSATSSLSLISRLSDSKTLNTSHGMYGFLKPTDPTDFNYQSHLKVNAAGVIIDSSYPIDLPGSFMVMCVNVPGGGAGAAGYYTVNASVEYLTEDVWRHTDVPNCSADEYRRALIQLKYIDQFHENPLHVKEIWESIKKGASTVAGAALKYGPTALKLAALLL